MLVAESAGDAAAAAVQQRRTRLWQTGVNTASVSCIPMNCLLMAVAMHEQLRINGDSHWTSPGRQSPAKAGCRIAGQNGFR